MHPSRTRWIVPAVTAVLLGSALHFAFALLWRFPAAGVFASVNESVWEHMKLCFWPMLATGALACIRFGYSVREWAVPLAVSVTASVLFIPFVYYFLLSGLGFSSLVSDILLFIAAVFAGYRILDSTLRRSRFYPALPGLVTLAVWGAFFVLFTFFPPHLPLFMDLRGGFYGIGP